MKIYLMAMAVRLFEMKRILKPTGSIYLHCDPTASHYLKLMMDGLFGTRSFRNEIAWCYGGRGMAKTHFNRKHDVVFYFANSKAVFNADAVRRPIAEKHTGRYNQIDDDGRRYANIKNRDGSYSRIYYKEQGVVFEDFWSIPYVRGKERTGYPTQKPLKLLERIIKASSNEGDVVLDPFCGCATACVAAEQLGRQWIGIDISPSAEAITKLRLQDIVDTEVNAFPLFNPMTDVFVENAPPVPTHKREETVHVRLPDYRIHKHELFGLQEGRCNGCRVSPGFGNMDVDHIIPKAKGGTDHRDNLQVLCRSCNCKKGTGTQEELLVKLREEGYLVMPQSA